MNTPQSSRAYDNTAALGGAPASDEQRERAIRLLTDAYAYDVITDDEFERRLGRLGLSASPAAIVAMATLAGRITGFMSETRRKGPWHVPQQLSVRAIMCDMKIDLRYAAIPPGCRIDVRAIMSSVAIIVPPGLVVGFDVDPILGSAGSDADPGFLNSAAHVYVSGSAIMADVRVKVRTLG